MAFEIFGYEISKKKDKAPQAAVVTPVTPRDDGASIVYSSDSGSYGAAAGYYGYQFDLDGVVRNESQMINQYRTVACFPEVDGAIEAIVNDAVIIEQGRDPVSLNLDGLPKQYHPLRDTIREHFDHVLNVLNFNDNCHDIFKRWYIDGRLYYYVMIDPKNPKKGIVDLKYIDPRKIRKVIEYQRENRNGIDVIVGQKSYYIFNDAGLQSAALGVKLSTDSIINVRSGLVDANTGEVISHLFKGIKPANQLKMMEDALVIYRITRAPERRVFYVDVGNLPGLKAEQYVNNVMNKFRNKVVYDAETGEVKNNRNYMSVCFTMDTKVRLVDGRVLTLDEMSRLYQTEDLEVYSYDPDTGHRTIGKVQWAGVTGYNRDVMTLTLSNGCNVTCTPDHRFVVQKGGFVEAKDLSVGEQLLTLSDECCIVVGKQVCEDRCEVGCLRVDNEYHTFALDADVFVHNCEDFFLPRREGGKATEIQTLPGSSNLSEIADIEYFQKKLYQSLNVPRQRLLNDNVMSIGNPNEVTREELAFAKFIQRLRNRFNVLFKEALRIQLITTNCIRQSDWEKIRNCIYFEYQHDNYFEELKRIEVFNERMTQLQTADGFKGIYFSKEYIVRNILEMTQEEWEEIQQQMKQEKIDEAREASELENVNAGDQESDDQFGQDSSESEGDDGYNDFVSGNDSAPEEVDQEGDTTDTIDDTAEPNPGEDDFDRPATPGLKATM
jgi:T4gp20-like protein|nr:MAG TPA: capsid assembly protein [Caudoviricetes sp.]